MSERSQAGTRSPSRGKPGPHPALCASLSRFAGEGLKRGAFVGWVEPKAKPIARRSCRSEEHTSEVQSIMRTSYAVSGLQKNKQIGRAHATTPLPNTPHLYSHLIDKTTPS